jgi:hypothetical protein
VDEYRLSCLQDTLPIFLAMQPQYVYSTEPPIAATLQAGFSGSGTLYAGAAYLAGTGTRQDTFNASGALTAGAGYLAGTGTRQDTFSGTGTLYAGAGYLTGSGKQILPISGTGTLTAAPALLDSTGFATDFQGTLLAAPAYLSGSGTFIPWAETEFDRVPPKTEFDIAGRKKPAQDIQARRRAPQWPGRRDTYSLD